MQSSQYIYAKPPQPLFKDATTISYRTKVYCLCWLFRDVEITSLLAVPSKFTLQKNGFQMTEIESAVKDWRDTKEVSKVDGVNLTTDVTVICVVALPPIMITTVATVGSPWWRPKADLDTSSCCCMLHVIKLIIIIYDDPYHTALSRMLHVMYSLYTAAVTLVCLSCCTTKGISHTVQHNPVQGLSAMMLAYGGNKSQHSGSQTLSCDSSIVVGLQSPCNTMRLPVMNVVCSCNVSHVTAHCLVPHRVVRPVYVHYVQEIYSQHRLDTNLDSICCMPCTHALPTGP